MKKQWMKSILIFFFVCLIGGMMFFAGSSVQAETVVNDDALIDMNSLEAWEDDSFADVPAYFAFLGEAVVTEHSITIDGETLGYTATAGFLPMYDEETGEEIAFMYYTAYERDGFDDSSDRPVTFVFNGGPGASSMYLHIGAFGPKIAPSSPDGTELPAPPYRLSDNQHTILGFTDLVFIDPVGTGFSQVRSFEEARYFWGVQEDIRSVTEFIRLFLSRHERWLSPLFVAGESYGGIRASGLALSLQDMGIFPSGIVLISPILDYEASEEGTANTLFYALHLPALAATAWYHGKVERTTDQDLYEFLEEVRKWSMTEYLYALNRGNTLEREKRQAIIETLSQYLGIAQADLELNGLRIEREFFVSELLKDQSLFCSLYDGRVTAYGTYDYRNDPTFIMTGGPFVSPFNDYLRRELGIVTDLPYHPLSDTPIMLWNWLSGTLYGNMGYPETASSLETAMKRTAFLQVFIGTGLYDMVTTYDHNRFVISQFDLPEDRLENITFATYKGGHMMYMNSSEHARLKEDLALFYQGALGE